MTQSSTQFEFKFAWTFPQPVEERIADFINKHPGKWLHAPVGISKLGKDPTLDKSKIEMVTFDRDESLKPDVVGDIFKLPQYFGAEFDGVISDPIWYFDLMCQKCGNIVEKNKGLSYPSRRYLNYAVRDVLKPGGYWIFNGLWLPKCKGMKILEPIEIPAQKFASFRNVSLLVYSKKVNERLN